MRLHKVASHSHTKGIRQDNTLTDGNEIADHWAGVAAKQVECDWGKVKNNRMIDGSAWKIQARIMAAIHIHHQDAVPEATCARPPYICTSQLDAALVQLGHMLGHGIPGYRATNRRQRCLRCGQSWRPEQRSEMIQIGECPGPIGPRQWNFHPGAPVPIPGGSQMIHEGVSIHFSHTLRWHRGILWCARCGAYSVSRVVGLLSACKLTTHNASAKRVRKRLARGLPPDGCDFPLAADVPCPYTCAKFLSCAPTIGQEEGIPNAEE